MPKNTDETLLPNDHVKADITELERVEAIEQLIGVCYNYLDHDFKNPAVEERMSRGFDKLIDARQIFGYAKSFLEDK